MNIIKNKKLIIFDFDGVIAISNHIKTEAFAELYEKYGKDIVNKVVSHHLLNQGKSRYEKIRYYHSNFLKIILKENELNMVAENFSKLVKEKVILSEFIPGVIKFLNYCKKNKIICAVNTATPEIEIREIIIKKKINEFFQIILGSPSNKFENLKKIIEATDIDKKETLFFGDALSDYKSALEADIDFIGIGELFKNKNYVNMIFSSNNFNDINIKNA